MLFGLRIKLAKLVAYLFSHSLCTCFSVSLRFCVITLLCCSLLQNESFFGRNEFFFLPELLRFVYLFIYLFLFAQSSFFLVLSLAPHARSLCARLHKWTIFFNFIFSARLRFIFNSAVQIKSKHFLDLLLGKRPNCVFPKIASNIMCVFTYTTESVNIYIH